MHQKAKQAGSVAIPVSVPASPAPKDLPKEISDKSGSPQSDRQSAGTETAMGWGLNAIYYTAKQAFRGSHPWLKFLIMSMTFVALIATLFGCLWIFRGEQYLAMAAFMVTVISLLYTIFLFKDRISEVSGARAGQPAQTLPKPTYEVEFLCEDQEDSLIQDLHEKMKICLDACVSIVQKQHGLSEVDKSHFRTNIFFPHYMRSGGDFLFRLYMHKSLKIKMSYRQEDDVYFALREGVTGTAFYEGQQRSEAVDFGISPERKSLLHPDMKWVISTPLRSKRKKPIAILNFDWLHYTVTSETREQVERYLRLESRKIESNLRKFKKSRARFYLE